MSEAPSPVADDPVGSFGRPIGIVALAAAAVALVAGVLLVFVYRPRSVGWLRTLHSGGAGVAVISAVVYAVVARSGRVRRSGRVMAAGLAVVVLLGAAFATGPWMAWTGGRGDERGVFLSPEARVEVSGRAVGRGGLLAALAIHVAVTLCAATVVLGGYGRSKWRQRRTRRG